MSNATFIMYHYVRNLANPRFPNVKGITPQEFERQLDYLQANYALCSLDDIRNALREPPRSGKDLCHLTFDDGLVDHYSVVMPILLRRGLTASFYATAKPVLERRVLDVHKIQFVLATAERFDEVRERLQALLRELKCDPPVGEFDELMAQRYEGEKGFDTPLLTAFKRLLQRDLPEKMRKNAVDRLFREYVTEDEQSFADELYLSPSQLREMIANGMGIGGHGYSHTWMGEQDRSEQDQELRRSAEFLAGLGCGRSGLAMSYPFGSFNQETIAACEQNGFALAFTTQKAKWDFKEPHTIPRLDTRDVPS